MHKVLSKKSFWTFVCFIAFLIFTVSLITHMWWLNIFTMLLGLAFEYKGDKIVFPQYAKLQKQREANFQKYLDKRQERNMSYIHKRNK